MKLDDLVNALEKAAKIVSYVGPSIAAFWALFVYRSNARRERARWAETLYSRFFVGLDFKKVRDILDCEPDESGVLQLVENENADRTDYLNFFEFVQYLQASKQLSNQDVQALFGYYLECLKKHPRVVAYVSDRSRGFDYLRKRLTSD